jgi:hypothetical protein
VIKTNWMQRRMHDEQPVLLPCIWDTRRQINQLAADLAWTIGKFQCEIECRYAVKYLTNHPNRIESRDHRLSTELMRLTNSATTRFQRRWLAGQTRCGKQNRIAFYGGMFYVPGRGVQIERGTGIGEIDNGSNVNR